MSSRSDGSFGALKPGSHAFSSADMPESLTESDAPVAMAFDETPEAVSSALGQAVFALGPTTTSSESGSTLEMEPSAGWQPSSSNWVETDPSSVESGEVEDGRVVLARNEVIGQYWIEGDAPLGSGSFGTVYRARHALLDRVCALKILHRSDKNARQRFLREAKILDAIRDRAVIDIYDVFTHEIRGQSMLVIAMEFVEGCNLFDYWSSERRPLRMALSVISDVAESLRVLHRHGVIHRDLKPQNVLVRENLSGLRARLIDYGLLKVLGDTELRLSADRSVIGTPYYYSPEQYSNEVGTDSDIYTLGLIFYALVTGRLPHVPTREEIDNQRAKIARGANVRDLPSRARSRAIERQISFWRRLQVLKRRQSMDPAPPLELNPKIGAELNALILSMLNRDRSQRPSAAELIERLDVIRGR